MSYKPVRVAQAGSVVQPTLQARGCTPKGHALLILSVRTKDLQAQGNNPSWQAAPAWALFDLQPPWGSQPESFPMTETGQVLMNRFESA